jgi:hypothetical protein
MVARQTKGKVVSVHAMKTSRNADIAAFIRAYISSLNCNKIAMGPQKIHKCLFRIFSKIILE